MIRRRFDLINDFEIKPLGETALIVKFGNEISPQIHYKIKSLSEYLEKYPFVGMVEYVISYTSLAIYYNPFTVKKSFSQYKEQSAVQIVATYIKDCVQKMQQVDESRANVVEIPVCYGGKYGPDIEFVAKHNNLSMQEVIDIHTAPQYLVYMIGFCPGFPYLGGMDKRIATPRREVPRIEIPARSIGIAGEQTGGYPISTPGGWQIIGRTPIEMFNPDDEENPTLLHSGDLVKFYAVSEKEYLALKGERAHES
ncbi:MAG TPA: 5-oxoprolinase subunit PxpB [Candidatus Megamonas gallistercoris]|nr:5-oxoprolinase subunit PxpB [Candidatus Megamonas gallistercoris]